jgi:hypothetical protein
MNREIFVLIGLLTPSLALAHPGTRRFPEAVAVVVVEQPSAFSPELASLWSTLPPHRIEPPRPSNLLPNTPQAGRFSFDESSVVAASLVPPPRPAAPPPPIPAPPLVRRTAPPRAPVPAPAPVPAAPAEPLPGDPGYIRPYDPSMGLIP